MNNRNYDDIINLPRPVSKKHTPMSRIARAGQFAPFAALTGHDAAIKETARLTDKKLILTEDEQRELNERLQILTENAKEKPLISVNYFIPDENKAGGRYDVYTGNIRKVDDGEFCVIFTDGTKIAISDIYSIEGEIFDFVEI